MLASVVALFHIPGHTYGLKYNYKSATCNDRYALNATI